MIEQNDALSEYNSRRDFAKTPEPPGKRGRKKTKTLRFLVQKHAARRLHYDLRLELDGVLKSWAVPRGPSVDPGDKRLAVRTEDHPLSYGDFEGVIPAEQYGGGTVMLWDRGTYTYGGSDPDPVEGLRRGYEKGDFKFVLNGKRLKGSWTLVRMRRDRPGKQQWLLIKHRDEHAAPGSDVAADYQTSVATGRTMDEIAGGKSRVWRSNRSELAKGAKPEATAKPENSAYGRLMARRSR
jgi:bifunctional non-homologous end joining protein LigD